MSTPLRVLIVEDSEDDTLMLLRQLQHNGYDVTYERVDTAEAMSAALDRQTWDIILDDYTMPRFSGPEALRLVKEKGPDLPFIVISDGVGEYIAIEAMKAGARDYIMKSNLTRLVPIIIRELAEAGERRKQRQVEEELRRLEERYSILAEQSEDATVVIQDGLIKFVSSRKSTEIIGFTPEEVLDQPFLNFIAPEWRDEVVDKYKRRMAGEEVPNRYEVEILHKDGTKIPTEITTSVIKYEGKPADMVVFRDVVERKKAEEARQAAEENFRHSLDESPLGIRIVNAEGELLYANQAILDVYGYSSVDELEAAPPQQRYTPQSYFEHLERKESRKLGKPGPPDYEISIVRKDGKLRRLSVFRKEVVWDGKTQFQMLYQDITEQKRAEEALREREEKLRTMFESANDGFAVIDSTGQVLEANEAYLRIFGYRHKEELIGQNTFNSIAEKDKARAMEDMRRLFKEERSAPTEYTLLDRDGREFCAELSAALLRDSSGNPVGVISVIRDITERKRVEEALRASEERFRVLTESTSDWVWEVDADGIYTYASPKVNDLLGYKPQEVIGKTPFDLMPPEEAKRTAEEFRAIVESQRPFAGLENTNLHKDGRLVVLETSGVPFFDAEGRLCGYRGIDRDITKRKKAEKALREAEGKYRALMDNASDMILLADNEGNILEANRKAEELLGYTREELLHMTVPQIRPKEQQKRVSDAFREITQKGYVSLNDGLILRKDGRTVTVDITGNTIEYAGKKISQGIFRDTTERKKMEQQLIVTDRLASIGELVSGIAHELNNPLTSVIGFSELLLVKDMPDDVKEDLRTINKEAQRTATIIRNLLTFARKHPEKKQSVDINNIIQKALEPRIYEQRINNVQVNTQLAPGLPEIMADAFQLQQVFMNIIINAEYFMVEAHRGGTLTITTEQVGDIIRVSLADDGPGIAKENLGHIFDPFFTTKEVGKGTGLGLSICHGIITAHSGRIYAESEPGKGVTFLVELPIS